MARKKNYDIQIEKILKDGSHKTEILTPVRVCILGGINYTKIKLRECKKELSRMDKLIHKEHRKYTTEEYAVVRNLRGIIKKLNKLQDYQINQASEDCIRDEDLKDISTQTLWKMIQELNGKDKELDAKYYKEYNRRVNVKKALIDLYDNEKLTLEGNGDCEIIGVFTSDGEFEGDINDILHTDKVVENDIVDDTPVSDKIDEFFKEKGEPITPNTAKEIIKEEKNRRDQLYKKNKRKIAYEGWIYSS